MRAIRDEDIGGAIVTSAFRRGTEYVLRGTRLSREDVLAIRKPNRNSMIENGVISIYPLAGESPGRAPVERHVISRGFGKFDVIEGRQLNDAPMSKEDAEELAAAGHGSARKVA